MSGSHNNQLNMVSLFDEEPATPTHKPPRKRNRNMPAPMCHSKNLLEHDGPIDTYRGPEVDNSYINYGYQRDLHQRGEYHAMHGWPAPAPAVQGGNKSVSYTPTYDSDYAESDREDHRPSKIPKINKDGVPRKPRQPRPKLLKWSDNDWKNVVLGIVWACGETGVQIPFDQAAQVVGDSCTAGALQQAILKLRGKQIDEGYQIPSLRMAWTRKNKRASSSSSSANANFQPSAGQDPLTPSRPSRPSLIVKLKIPVSSKVVAMHAPKFNKAGADCVRKESKEKDAVLNQLQDQKPAVVDDEVFEIQIDGPKTKDGLYGFKVEGLPVNHPLPNGIASEGIRAIDVVQGPLSQLDRTAGHGRDLVEQAVASAYNHSHESPFAYDEDLNDFQAYDFCGNGSQDSLLPSSSSGGPSSCGFLPEMSSPLGHAYKSPYSLLPGDDASRPPQPAASSLPQEQELAQPLPLYSSGQGAKCLDVGHFPDMFPHDVFSNCGFAQGSFADVYKTKAPEGYGFNAGHYT